MKTNSNMLATKSVALAVTLLVLAQLFMSCRASKSNEPIEQELCGDKHVKLKSFSDLRRTTAKYCDQHIKEAHKDLLVLATQTNVCTLDKARDIVHYHETHLKPHVTKPSGQVRGAKELFRFAIIYGMLVSNACKRVLFKDFYRKIEAKLIKLFRQQEDKSYMSDFETMVEWIADEGPIGRLLKPLARRNEFLLPSDLSSLVPEFESEYITALKITNSNRVIRLQEICGKIFRPLYEPIVMPIALLARNGFNYNEHRIDRKMFFKPEYQTLNDFWSRVVFLCESLKEFKVFEAPAGSEPGSVDIVTNDEETKGEIESSPTSTSTGLKQADRYQAVASLGNFVMQPFDFRLNNAVKAYNVSLSEPERFQMNLLGKRWKLFRFAVKSKDSMRDIIEKACAMTKARKGVRYQDKELDMAKKDLMKLLDADKRSRFFRVISMISRLAKGELRVINILLPLVIKIVSIVVFTIIVPLLIDPIKSKLKRKAIS